MDNFFRIKKKVFQKNKMLSLFETVTMSVASLQGPAGRHGTACQRCWSIEIVCVGVLVWREIRK